MLALISLCALFLAGVSLGVHLSAGHWLELLGLMLLALIPFAPLGIAIGHMLTPDSIGPALGGGISLLALLGGTWFPLGHSGFLYHLAQFLPSYWLVQASHVALGGPPWPARAWIVLAVWTVLLTAGARYAFRRDTARV
jgi:ABC-2 type transport system permease protein